jgi:two-component sensor histidine kinase
MALVHEQLHQADYLSLIPFREYLQELVGHLIDTGSESPIRVQVKSHDISLEIYRAVPCGLIVNELVTNAMEHAFAPGVGGTITVSFRDQGERYVLEVADNGVGMPEKTERSLGLTLVETLAQQVHGSLTVSVEAGTRFTVALPKQAQS